MKTTREEVYKVIDGERNYQNTKWAGHSHEVGAYLTMMRNYMTKAEYAWTDNNGELPALDVIRKIAAICVHCMEENGIVERKNVTNKNWINRTNDEAGTGIFKRE
jgi:hypothetical protein